MASFERPNFSLVRPKAMGDECGVPIVVMKKGGSDPASVKFNKLVAESETTIGKVVKELNNQIQKLSDSQTDILPHSEQYFEIFRGYFSADSNRYRCNNNGFDRKITMAFNRYYAKTKYISSFHSLFTACNICGLFMDVREIFVHMCAYHNFDHEYIKKQCPFCFDPRHPLWKEGGQMNVEHIFPCSLPFNLNDSPMHDDYSRRWVKMLGIAMRKVRKMFNTNTTYANINTIPGPIHFPEFCGVTLADVLEHNYDPVWEGKNLKLHRRGSVIMVDIQAIGSGETKQQHRHHQQQQKRAAPISRRRATVHIQRLQSPDTDANDTDWNKNSSQAGDAAECGEEESQECKLPKIEENEKISMVGGCGANNIASNNSYGVDNDENDDYVDMKELIILRRPRTRKRAYSENGTFNNSNLNVYSARTNGAFHIPDFRQKSNITAQHSKIGRSECSVDGVSIKQSPPQQQQQQHQEQQQQQYSSASGYDQCYVEPTGFEYNNCSGGGSENINNNNNNGQNYINNYHYGGQVTSNNKTGGAFYNTEVCIFSIACICFIFSNACRKKNKRNKMSQKLHIWAENVLNVYQNKICQMCQMQQCNERYITIRFFCFLFSSFISPTSRILKSIFHIHR